MAVAESGMAAVPGSRRWDPYPTADPRSPLPGPIVAALQPQTCPVDHVLRARYAHTFGAEGKLESFV